MFECLMLGKGAQLLSDSAITNFEAIFDLSFLVMR